MDGTGGVALSGLLSRALVAFAHDFEGALPESGQQPAIVLWSNVLRLFEGGAPNYRREIPKLARLSTRTMRSTIDGLERIGWVTVSSGLVSLAAPARAAHDAWRPLPDQVETDWCGRFGDERIETLRRALERLVVQLPFEMAHYPTGYGVADCSMTGRGWSERDRKAGDDWHPVRRDGDAGVDGLALSALLSQALIAFAVDYEQHGQGPILFGADVLDRIDDAGTPLGEAPPAGGIAGNGKSVLERHGLVTVGRTGPRATRLVHLTDRGRRWRDAYEPLTGRTEDEWMDRYGGDVVALRTALEALDPDLDPALPHFPFVAWSFGLGFAEASHLAMSGT